MKRYIQCNIGILIALLFNASIGYSQVNLKPGNTVSSRVSVSQSSLDSLVVVGRLNVNYIQSDSSYITLKSGEGKLLELVKVEDNNSYLKIRSLSSAKVITDVEISLYAPTVKTVSLLGSAEFHIKDGQELASNDLTFYVLGNSYLDANVNTQKLKVKLGGSSYAKLSGETKDFNASAMGASELLAKDLVAQNVRLRTAGVSAAYVNADSSMELVMKDLSLVKFNGVSDPDIKYKSANSDLVNASGVHIESENTNAKEKAFFDEDISSGDLGVISWDINEDDAKVRAGRNVLCIDEDEVRLERRAKKTHKYYKKFIGHFAGLEIGLNGYLNKDFNMDFGKKYSYLDLRMEKSANININFFDQGIPFNKSKTFGMVTGIGFSIHNYRFSKPTHLDYSQDVLQGYFIKGVSIRKSKLVTNFVTVPILFEYQNHSKNYWKRFFIQVGGSFGLKVHSHTKEYFESTGTPYSLVDPVTGQEVEKYAGVSEKKQKQRNSFYLNPVRVDATVRVGLGIICLYGTYSVTNMFKLNKGPELHPFSLGLTFSTW
ncbi:MAG: GIN domain-containing protein [Bacteroidales bacterium]